MKKKNKQKIHDLEETVRLLTAELDSYDAIVDMHRESADRWRQRYEQAVSTPEIKADIEGAFRRGGEAARQALIGHLFLTLNDAPIPEESK